MIRRLLASGVVLLLGGVALSGAAFADGIRFHAVELVSPSGDPIAGGGSATPFTVRLPDGAACPGDSADDGYRINSYMVPDDVDPSSISFDGTGPVPSVYGRYDTFRQPLYDVESNSFVSAQTANAPAPGQPGLIVNLPLYNFAVYGRDDLPVGRYHVGIVCTLLNEVMVGWDAQVEVNAAADDPAGIHWQAIGYRAPADEGPSTAVLVALVVSAAVMAIVVLRRRRTALPFATTQKGR